MGKKGIHNAIVSYLYDNPDVLGINSALVQDKAMELEMYKGSDLFVVPDLYFDIGSRYFYFEVKSSRSKSCRDKGHSQMARTLEWLKTYEPHNVRKSTIGLVYPIGKQRKLETIVDNLEFEYLRR